ncbi:MAG: hypothetical protein C0505_13030 [Leptothrix sp. (in: Bacteria)]|nr:hypothetical protein [Leptothrix sp. (in: b-proteobacteria)]
MSSADDLSRMVPGFDFLQSFIKGASASLPGVQGFGQWVAPTLDPEELDKRIQELKTVQFWLEQNARLLGATIQALEVQRMTLATLQTLNLPLAELRDALQARPAAAAAPAPAPAPAPTPAPSPAPAPASEAAAPGAIDPMKWWGALTQQFTEIATKAVQDGGAEAARHRAGIAAAQAQAAAPARQAAAKSTPRKSGKAPAAAARKRTA